MILKVGGIVRVKGGRNGIIEYLGEGRGWLCGRGKGSMCKMGGEVGGRSWVFG